MADIYEGDRPYIFVNYAHADRRAALPIIHALACEGYRVWYDDGIHVGSSFPDHIANRIHDCSCMLVLVSRFSCGSDWCCNEVEYALELGKSVLPVYLEDVELSRALQMRLGRVQALFRFACTTSKEFCEKLFRVPMLDSCLTARGKYRRGVKPKAADVSNDSCHVATLEVDMKLGDDSIIPIERSKFAVLDGSEVMRKTTVGDYSWREIKLLSRAIANVEGKDDWKTIAKEYNLLGVDGNLHGALKSITLTNGIKTMVRILGFRHDELSTGGGMAGITFEFAGVPLIHAMNNGWTNKGGWRDSEMRRWLNHEFLELLPTDLKRQVVCVRKKTNNSGAIKWNNDISSVTVTDDKIWSLAICEVYGRFSEQMGNAPWSSHTYDAEGIQYKYYADTCTSLAQYAISKKGGVHSSWWLRSPNTIDSYEFLSISDVSAWDTWDADCALGVSPAFCL